MSLGPVADPYTEIWVGRSSGRLQQNCDLPASL